MRKRNIRVAELAIVADISEAWWERIHYKWKDMGGGEAMPPAKALDLALRDVEGSALFVSETGDPCSTAHANSVIKRLRQMQAALRSAPPVSKEFTVTVDSRALPSLCGGPVRLAVERRDGRVFADGLSCHDAEMIVKALVAGYKASVACI